MNFGCTTLGGREKGETILRQAIFALVLIALCGLGACFEWSENAQGNLTSVGLPGIPIWKSKETGTLNPTDFGFTPEEASKFGGLVLVQPPSPPSQSSRYRFYPKEQNHCEDDLKKMLADREQRNAAGPEPYCTETPPSPTTARGHAFIF